MKISHRISAILIQLCIASGLHSSPCGYWRIHHRLVGVTYPGHSGEVIDILVEHGLLNRERRDRYVSMIQFRNRIVHFYNAIDLKIFYQILQEELVDIRELYRALILIIEEHPE